MEDERKAIEVYDNYGDCVIFEENCTIQEIEKYLDMFPEAFGYKVYVYTLEEPGE